MTDSEILLKAKDAFVGGRNSEVIELLTPLRNYSDINIRGTINFILGLSYLDLRDIDSSAKSFEIALKSNYSDVALYETYGTLVQRNDSYDKAEVIYKRGIELCGKSAKLLSNLATISIIRGDISNAANLLQESINSDNNDYMAWTNLGNLNQQRCYYRDAVEAYKKAIAIKPDFTPAISNLLLTANYTPTPQCDVFTAHKHYSKSITTSNINRTMRDKNSKIRIGYISADLKTHSVSYFFSPILNGHDTKRFEIYCYSDVAKPDPVTLSLQKKVSVWRDVSPLTVDETAQLVYDDNIDVLVDLAGHVGNRFLPLFKAKPARFQVTYLGYPNTTGLDTVDYRFTDSIADDENQDQFYSEKLIRLTPPFIRYLPSKDLPIITELPYNINGFITFGSFNNLAKLSEDTLSLWADLLLKIPNSKLYLKSKPLKDSDVCENILLRFEAKGVNRERVRLEGHKASNSSHLNAYNDIDIALDTSPYNGTTTTCEALIMGVPVLTLVGSFHASRVGYTILKSIKLDNLIAFSVDEFINRAFVITNDVSELENLRVTLRERFKSSSISDGKALTKEFEDFYSALDLKD